MQNTLWQESGASPVTANTKPAELLYCFGSTCALLQAATCADVRPVSKPGVKYECPVHTEFVPEEAKTFPPTQSACCKVGPAAAVKLDGLVKQMLNCRQQRWQTVLCAAGDLQHRQQLWSLWC
jgi:hypothetical protein